MGEPELASLLGELAQAHSVPGAALGLLRDGTIVTARAGVADATTGDPITTPTRFAVGSLCKSMVATAIALLAADGRLSLEDPVAARVPELCRAAWARHATLRDLLANRARVPQRAGLEFGSPAGDDDGALRRLVAEAADAEPARAAWSYSNLGWCVLGRVLETATGRPWEDAMRAEVFAPLGLTETGFVRDARQLPRAHGHEATADGPVPAEPWQPRALGPAGSTLLSTVADLLRFAQAHLEGGVLAELRTTAADVRIHAWLDAWCLGWARFDWDGGPVWGWDGLVSGQRAVVRLVPERRGAAVLLTNCGAGRALYRALFPELMDAWFGVRMPQLDLRPSVGAAGDLTRFAGVYGWADRRRRVLASTDALVLEHDGGAVEARPLDARTFVVDARDPDVPTVTFGELDEDGRPGVLYEMLWALPRA